MSSNLDKLLQQQEAMNSFRNAQKEAFNGFDLEKQIYDAKKSAIETGKGLTRQLVGQERLEALMAAPAIAKTAVGVGKTALRAAADPAGFAEAARKQAYESLKSQYKSITGRDLPGSLEEARAEAESEARGAVEGAVGEARGAVEGAVGQAREAGERLAQTATSAGRSAQETATGTAQRFRQTIDSKIPETGLREEETLVQGRSPFFGQGGPARRIPEPGDADFAAFEARQKALETPDMPVGEVESVGPFPREGLPTPRGRIGEPAPITESENRANILRQISEQREPVSDIPALSARAEEPELPDVEDLKSFGQKIQEGRSALRPTETREADVDLSEAQRFGARPIARSLARQPLTPEEAARAGFRPPTTPRPERPGIIREEPGPTEGPGGYVRPGTELRIPATREAVPQFRGEAPSAVAERQESEAAEQALAQRGQTESFFGDIERGGARVARGARSTALDDELRQAERSAAARRYGGEGIRAAGQPAEEGFESIYPDLSNVRATTLDEDLDEAARRTTAPDLDEAIERQGARTLADVDARTGFGLPDLPRTTEEMPRFPEPPTAIRGGDVPSTARGEETSRLGPEPEGRPPLAPEAEEPSEPIEPYTNQVLNERFGSARPQQPDLPELPEHEVDEYGLPKEPDPVRPEASEAGAEADASKVASETAESALKTGGEEIAAEAPLDAVPGLGELVMAGTLLGSLFHAHHEEKEAEKQSAGPPPKPPQDSMPTMAFDSAPTLDTSSYHSL